ncbi:some similarities with uniprot [Nakaseomyces bracarensis]|uniref:Some similarities with uniprot n=1 Tax=Nakaseomyces bracarensis TaxID=273131 RepID=A0ABR4NPK7_9SACH
MKALVVYFISLLFGVTLAKNPVTFDNVCGFSPEQTAQRNSQGFKVTTARLSPFIAQNTYKELLNYPGTFNLVTQIAYTTNPSFKIGGIISNLYGLTVYPSYIIVELVGYFVPTVSGNYTFGLTGSDDAAIIFLGNGATFPCGAVDTWPDATEGDITVTDKVYPNRTVYMIKDVPYPIRISFYNTLADGILNAWFTDPSGTKHSDWAGYIWQYPSCTEPQACTYTPHPTTVNSYISTWVLSTELISSSTSSFTGLDGDVTPYYIYVYNVPTVTESVSVPDESTFTLTYDDRLVEEVVSFYSTTASNGSPILASTTVPVETFLIIPPPMTITLDKGKWVEEDLVSYFTTQDSEGHNITGSTTSTITYMIDLPQPTTVNITKPYEIIEEQVSYYSTTDKDGYPDIGTTTSTITVIHSGAPSPTTDIVDLGNDVTEYLVISYFTTEDDKGSFYTANGTRTYSPPQITTIETEGDHEHIYTIVSYFITVDDAGEIITSSTVINASTVYDPAPSPTTTVVDLGSNVTEYVVISYWTTDDENGKLYTASSSSVYSPPPVTTIDTTNNEEGYYETDIVSYFITTDDAGSIITSSSVEAYRVNINSDAAYTSLSPPPPNTTETVDLGNNVTEYVVISYWISTNEYGGYITASNSSVYSPPPVTTIDTTNNEEGYYETDIVSYFITTDDAGSIITSSSVEAYRVNINSDAAHTSLSPPPPNTTETVDLGNNVTEYVVISYWISTNEYGGYITASNSSVYSPPAVLTLETTNNEEGYIETDIVSYFITTDSAGSIITSSSLEEYRVNINSEAPHSSLNPAPPTTTETVDLGNNVTEYVVISYWISTNEYGGYITASNSSVYSPPPVTTIDTTNNEEGYYETDIVSYFITTDDAGSIITSSSVEAYRVNINSDAAHTSLSPPPPNTTETVDLGNNVTEYVVISYWISTNEYGGYITASNSSVYSPPPVTTIDTTNNEEGYYETDIVSYFITTDDAGSIITSSSVEAYRVNINSDAAHTSLSPPPPNTTETVDLGNNVTEYVVISYWISTNEYGGYITASNSSVYSPPAVLTLETTNNEEGYIETDIVSYFITTDSAGSIITSSSLEEYRVNINSEAPHSSLNPAPPTTTETVDLGNNVTEYVVISYWISTNEYGGYITASNSSVYSPPPVTTIDTTNNEEGYYETDIVSYFITTDDAGSIITSSSLQAYRVQIDEQSVFTSLEPAPQPTTLTVQQGDGLTHYEVITYYITTNSFGGYITESSVKTFTPPLPITTTITKDSYVEEDIISYYLTVTNNSEIVTQTTTIYHIIANKTTSTPPSSPTITASTITDSSITSNPPSIISSSTKSNQISTVLSNISSSAMESIDTSSVETVTSTQWTFGNRTISSTKSISVSPTVVSSDFQSSIRTQSVVETSTKQATSKVPSNSKQSQIVSTNTLTVPVSETSTALIIQSVAGISTESLNSSPSQGTKQSKSTEGSVYTSTKPGSPLIQSSYPIASSTMHAFSGSGVMLSPSLIGIITLLFLFF